MTSAPRYERPAGRSAGIIAASLLFHLLILVVLAHRSRVWLAPVSLPGTAHGTRMVLTYLPGAASALSPPLAKITSTRRLVHPMRPVPASVQARALLAASSGTLHQDAGSGVDALGDGDVSIALMQFFPDPKPDLSRLPRGSHGDVVLESVISAEGRIAQLTLKQGIGYGVDESVVATVEQWTFHPAMRDGKPVASQQEFLFHYERS